MDWYVLVLTFCVGTLAGIFLIALMMINRDEDAVDPDDSYRLDTIEELGLSITNLGPTEHDPNGTWAVLNKTTVVGRMTGDLRTSIDSALEVVNG